MFSPPGNVTPEGFFGIDGLRIFMPAEAFETLVRELATRCQEGLLAEALTGCAACTEICNMKILRQLWNQKGLDAAVEDVPEDRYGFGNIAENISRSILTLPLEASNVVGIEGAWGSGKTSLLNLILRNLALKKMLTRMCCIFLPG